MEDGEHQSQDGESLRRQLADDVGDLLGLSKRLADAHVADLATGADYVDPLAIDEVEVDGRHATSFGTRSMTVVESPVRGW